MIDIFNESSIIDSVGITSEDVGIYQENPEYNILLAEAIICDMLNPEEMAALCENTTEQNMLIGDNILAERSIVRFDKTAKLNRAESQALIVIAREKKDHDLNKLIRIWKMRRIILDRWRHKYGNEAKRRAKDMVRRLGSSKAPSAKKAAMRIK